MDAQTTQRLVELNNEFYRANARSFSDTRQYAWGGWEQLARALPHHPQRVLDVACGNMRFKKFLEETYGAGTFEYRGVDACDELVPASSRHEYEHIDILESPEALRAHYGSQYDLVACFGFMHHVPGAADRLHLVDALADVLVPQGYACISFWQFGRDDKLRKKALESTIRGSLELGLELERGDCLLGWKDQPSTYRYCHDFTDAEIDVIAAHASCRVRQLQRFRADGKSGDLNSYLVLQKLN